MTNELPRTLDFCDRTADPDDVLVLLHGTGGTALSHFGPAISHLRAHYRIIAPDLTLGGLGSDAPNAVAALCDQAESALPELSGRGRRTLVGYSLGAVVAASLAARQPETWTHLVLIAGWSVTSAQQRLRQQLQLRLAERDPTAYRQLIALMAFGAPFLAARTDAEVAEIVAAAEVSPTAREDAMINSWIDISNDLDRIRASTLVIACTHDAMVPPAHAHELHDAIRGSTLVELAAGHAVLLEAPDRLADEIVRFHTEPRGGSPRGA